MKKNFYNQKKVKSLLKSNSNELWYHNIYGIRRSNISYCLNFEETNEYIKCENNINYFIENYCTLENNKKIQLKNYQKKILLNLSTYKLNAIATCRQIGITFLLNAITLHSLIFCKNYSVLFINNKLDKFKNMYINLPFFLKIGITKYTNDEINFENGNILFKKSSSINSLIGFSPNMIIIDDFDFIKNNDKLLNYLIPAFLARKKDKLILSSCFKNENSFFHKLIKKSINGIFESLLINCYDIEKYDIKWVDKKIKEIGYDNFNCEYQLFKESLKIKRAIKLKNLTKNI